MRRVCSSGSTMVCFHGAADLPVIFNNLGKYHLLQELLKGVVGFVDTVEVFHGLFRKDGCRLEDLCRDLGVKTGVLHDAGEDSRSLFN